MIFNNKIIKTCSLLVIAGFLVLSGCSAITGSDDGDDDDDNGGDEPTEYNLTVSTSPSEGGSVDPEDGTYEEGDEVTVEASSNAGWSFTNWSGDVESEDNPLTFEITSDTEITANFEEQPQAYSNELEVTDGTNSETVTFGMDENASPGYDDGLDEEAPPAPPEGSFYAHFIIDNYNLFTDYRPVVDERVEWELNFGAGGENTITLNWDFNPDNYLGSLTLVDDLDDPSIEVDMGSESSHEVSDESVSTLYIIQE